MNEEYLKAFKQVQENNNSEEELKPLNETPQYDDMESLNETPDLSQYQINENLNDGWNIDCEIKVNGVPQTNSNPYIQQNKKRKPANDPNGLNQFIGENSLNEVISYPKPQQIHNLQGPQTQRFEDVEVVTWEMFENINYKALGQLGNICKSKLSG